MRNLRKLGTRIVIFEGGEPFLWRDGDRSLADVVREARKLFFSVGVVTNGTFPITAEADIIWVSVDGLKDTHDRIRGNCFERVMANIEGSTHANLFAHVTINSLNWMEMPRLFEFLAPKVKGITLQFHYPYEGENDALVLPAEKRRAVLKEIIELKDAGLPVANSRACLSALMDNRWKCRPWMIASVNPDGVLTHGCYVKGRGAIRCDRCGFSAHTEMSLAFSGVPEAVLAGRKIFGYVKNGQN